MKIHGILTIYNSKMDRNGNRYWAFTYLDCNTGLSYSATGDGESNIEGIKCGFTKQYEHDDGIHVVHEELGYRDFNRMTKTWPYAGCRSCDVQTFIKSKIQAMATV